MERESVIAERVRDRTGRDQVVAVLRDTYEREKHWVTDPEAQFPVTDLERKDVSWFVARLRRQPVGVVRMVYDPSIEAYAAYGFRMLDPNIRVEEFVKRRGIAEIGRFAVLPNRRNQIMIAAALMRAATLDG